MLGDRFTAADVLWGNALTWTTGFKLVPALPVIQAYIDRWNARPSVARVRGQGRRTRGRAGLIRGRRQARCTHDLRYSVVIPAYNEEKLLPRLLDSLDVARAAYGPADAIEVIVADNMSTDRTAAIAAARGCRVVAVEKRVIAAVRNGGARAARGEILAFVDADSQVHRGRSSRSTRRWPRAASWAARRAPRSSAGRRASRWPTSPAADRAVHRAWIPAWCSFAGSDFEEVGGYDENRLVAEDVAFLLALKRLGKTRGQRLQRVTSAKVIVSTRKFDEFGDWHLFAMISEGMRHLMNRKPTEFTDRYWYKPKR